MYIYYIWNYTGNLKDCSLRKTKNIFIDCRTFKNCKKNYEKIYNLSLLCISKSMYWACIVVIIDKIDHLVF